MLTPRTASGARSHSSQTGDGEIEVEEAERFEGTIHYSATMRALVKRWNGTRCCSVETEVGAAVRPHRGECSSTRCVRATVPAADRA